MLKITRYGVATTQFGIEDYMFQTEELAAKKAQELMALSAYRDYPVRVVVLDIQTEGA